MTTIEFDKKVTCGPEFVALRIIENCDDMKVGNIWLPSMTGENERLAFCRIENVGSKAAEEYGLKAGDYAMIDRLSTFAHTAPVCVCKYNNVICLTDEKRSSYSPVRNMVFIEPDDRDDVMQINGVYVPGSYDEKMNLGRITAMNCDKSLDLPFKVGDHVLLTKGGDIVEFGETKIYIYKHDMLVCRIDD